MSNYNSVQLKRFLGSLEEFYKPKENEEKLGIGHEVEHICGVMLRARRFAKIVNENLEQFNEKKHIDYGIVATVAALHDIGNVIERDGHNHYGFGIIKGKLTVDDYFAIPVLNKQNNKFLQQEEIEEIKESIKKNNYTFVTFKPEYKNVIVEYLKTKAFFEIAYNKKEITNEDKLIDFLKEEFHGLPDDLLQEIKKDLYKEGKIIIEYNSKLAKITALLKDIFGHNSDELDIIAKAVQDHNVDYEDIGSRYRARSLYGSIVADADKDSSPEVFAIRTIAYAANKLGLTKHVPFCLDNNPPQEVRDAFPGPYYPNIKNCEKHVCHQSFERFRISEKEFVKRTGLSASDRVVQPEIAEYKPNLDKVKGVHVLCAIKCPNSQKKIDEIVGENNYFIDSKGTLIVYTIEKNAGADKYSQLFAISGLEEILAQRAKFFEKVEFWADINNEDKSLEEIHQYAIEWLAAKSNEEIIGKYEAVNAEEMQNGEMKEYSFNEIIKISIGLEEQYKEEISEISSEKPENEKELTENEIVETVLHGTPSEIRDLTIIPKGIENANLDKENDNKDK